MQDYRRLIDDLRPIYRSKPRAKRAVTSTIKSIIRYRNSGMNFNDMLMILPERHYEFLRWIGCLDIEFPTDFFSKYEGVIDWVCISSSVYGKIHPAFVDRYADRLDWDAVGWGLGPGHEDLLRRHDRLVDWESLSWTKTKLSEAFLREYADVLDWDGVFEKKKFKYPYEEYKASRGTLEEELIAELYKPDRIMKWITAGNDIIDYLQ